MLRKLNFTDRIRIPRNAVRIALRREEDGVLAFDPVLDLDAIEAPSHARVLIEAWYRNSYMRFDCGTVAELSIPESRRLVDIDSDRMARFRLKIVDGSRIIAVADDIAVATEQVLRGTREPLLPVNFRDLGDEVWRVEFEATGAVLELTNRVPGIEQMARTDGRFFSLVYPAAVRQILTHILLVEQYEPEDDKDAWWSLWLRWAEELAGLPPPDNEDERRTWIEEAARAFCGRHQAVTRFMAVKGDES